jgi:hypothetical protein
LFLLGEGCLAFFGYLDIEGLKFFVAAEGFKCFCDERWERGRCAANGGGRTL